MDIQKSKLVKLMLFVYAINLSIDLIPVLFFGESLVFSSLLMSAAPFFVVILVMAIIGKGGVNIRDNKITLKSFSFGKNETEKVDLAKPYQIEESRLFFSISQDGKKKLNILKYVYNTAEFDAFKKDISVESVAV